MQLWQNFSARAKIGLVIGSIMILLLAASLAWWAYRTDYAVLFADLSTGDASAMVAELERTKTPYQLSDGGRTILVPKDLVYKTRLKVMGKELPLHGAVGFEVFNNADFGMTEFVQKVNYQRAVQGELTRTILAIEDVQSARVHLAIPEQGLFKKALSKAKASVTLAMKSGRVLSQEQITGIQRLIAASVPDIVASDVTIIDQHGVPLTRVASHDGAVESAHTQLDSKRQVEDYLLKKVTPILDNMFGAGAAMASVDVVLNLDQDKITTEEVLPAKTAHNDGVPTGVVVRERQTTQGGNTAAAGTATAGTAGTGARDAATGNSSVESDYQTGRRVAQTVIAPGTTRRMTVAVVIKAALTPAQVEHVKEVVGLALGINSQRGDAIVVQTMDALITRAGSGLQPTPDGKLSALSDASVAAAAAIDATSASNGSAHKAKSKQSADNNMILLAILALLTSALIIALVFAARSSRQKNQAVMSEAERERLLQEIKQWMGQGAAEGRK